MGELQAAAARMVMMKKEAEKGKGVLERAIRVHAFDAGRPGTKLGSAAQVSPAARSM